MAGIDIALPGTWSWVANVPMRPVFPRNIAGGSFFIMGRPRWVAKLSSARNEIRRRGPGTMYLSDRIGPDHRSDLIRHLFNTYLFV